ncbi:MAG: sialidase family protein [Acidobacteria bacterium]|nr:sialidase family protein [Acidobacteriota bacterium]
MKHQIQPRRVGPCGSKTAVILMFRLFPLSVKCGALLGLIAALGAVGPGCRTRVEDHRVRVEIEGEVEIVPPGSGQGRGMLGIVRHPDGSIFVNTQSRGLVRSTDNGRTWEAIEAENAFALGVTRDGRLWLAGPKAEDAVSVSYSADRGRSWTAARVDGAVLAPSSKQPFDWVGDDYNTFLEGPDGTLMLGVGARYLPWYYRDPDLLQDGLVRPDADLGGLFLIRSTDGGASWGDPTLMHPFVCEVGLAADPFNPDRILAMTRIQRPLLAGEDRESTLEKTGCPDEVPSPEPSIYKNGLLLESHDRGRTFREVPGSLTGYYEHRGTILWTGDNVVVVTHQASNQSERYGALFARISLDGGKTWANGSPSGTPRMNQSTRFELVPKPPGHSFTAPTLELSRDRFLTPYLHGSIAAGTATVTGVFWRIERR